MSRVAELLARKRAAAILAMETGADVPTDDVDAALATVTAPASPKAQTPRSARLGFTRHARTRMSQRGMVAADVYAIYMCGEPRASCGDLAFWVTARSVCEAPAHFHGRLSRWVGCAIIVRPADDDGPSRLVTVLADGEDTQFTGRRGR